MDISNEKVYKKTYKPLLLWFIGFMVASISLPLILDDLFDLSSRMLTKISLSFTFGGVIVLMYIIYKGEYVYWINGGPSFIQASKASSSIRKAYAKAHLMLLLKAWIISIALMALSSFLDIGIWLDITSITLVFIIAAFKSMPIKFNEEEK